MTPRTSNGEYRRPQPHERNDDNRQRLPDEYPESDVEDFDPSLQGSGYWDEMFDTEDEPINFTGKG